MDYKYTYSGNLELYYETGFEGCHSVTLHDDRGITKGPSFNNNSQKWDGPEMDFHNLGWSVFFRGGEYLKVFEDGKVIWEGTLTKSRHKLMKIKYALSFIPEEVDTAIWVEWLKKELRAEISTNQPVLAEEKNGTTSS